MAAMLSSYFASPVALLTALALLIPLTIHLLSRSRGKVIKVGNIGLIPVARHKPVAQVQLTQKRLLVLRLLLLLLITLALAQGLFLHPLAATQSQKKLMVTNSWLDHASAQQRQELVEQLATQSAWLIDENSEIDGQRIANWAADAQIENRPGTMQNIWASIAQQTESVPRNYSVSVYSSNALSDFIGGKVHTKQAIDWHILTHWKPAQRQVSDSISVVVVADETSTRQLPLWQMAFTLLQTELLPGLHVEYLTPQQVGIDTQGEWLINLSAQALNSPVAILSFSQQQLRQADFPMVLAEQLVSHLQPSLSLRSQRLSKAQITEPAATPVAARRDLKHQAPSIPVWLIVSVVLLFCIERVISEAVRSHPSRADLNG